MGDLVKDQIDLHEMSQTNPCYRPDPKYFDRVQFRCTNHIKYHPTITAPNPFSFLQLDLPAFLLNVLFTSGRTESRPLLRLCIM